ncbi:hypothetical protein BZG35_10115 [Brevundimonas sp. LM2]|uniref:hypothetical protein n=1 Tax=Brevundimonas sp. LM2 TaxID=1938605 RepID=UPI0009840400|nr:hypothetical protein [Brevundimonas sp. LM2]AQR61965.1 hypothetical protein BZG35_10115 [Brevundimonas sp. LM2]
MTAAPDLETEAGRAAYRKELRQVALPLRWGGLALIILAALFCVAASRGLLGLSEETIVVGYAMLAAGWALVIATTFLRTRHHRRRMAEIDAIRREGAFQ